MLRTVAVLLLFAATAAAQVSTRPPGADGGTAFTGGTITTPILGPAADNCLAPPYSFTGDTTSGVCSSAAGVVHVRTSGTNRLSVSTTAVTSTLPFLAPSGTAGAPSFTFSGDATTGMYRGDAGRIRFSLSGTERLRLDGDTLQIVTDLQLTAGNGTRAAPSLSFSTEGDSGLYVVGAGEIGLSVNDTIAYSFAPSGAGHRFYIGNVEAMRIQSALGINQASGTMMQMITSGAALGSPDVGLARNSAGVVKVTDGGAGLGSLYALQIYFGSTADTDLVRDAATRLRVTDPATTGLGYIGAGVFVEANTTTKSAAITESGELYTNTGDADGSIINLPNDPAIGTQFWVALTVAQTVTINAAAGESIQDAGTNAASRTASAIGDTIRLVAVTGGSGAVWMVVSKTGTWT